MTDLGPIRRTPKSGSELFHDGDRVLDFDVLSFWQWSASDMVSNVLRGVLAEYLVARAIGAAAGVREEWAAYDLRDARGFTIEVKSAAYIQSWHQNRLSAITFNCRETGGWNSETGGQADVKRRQAQVYVFALLAHTEQATLDPLDVAQWEFYVLPTKVLDARVQSQHSITLKSLRTLHAHPPIAYGDLSRAIGDAGAADTLAIDGK